MKTKYKITLIFLLIITPFISEAQNNEEPWVPNQLIQPVELALKLEKNATNLYVYNIGPAGLIKNAIEIGSGREEENQLKFEKEVSKLPKDAEIVIYCGCCPFTDCPNIRPIFKILNKNQFLNHKLLNLQKNLKVDWIDKGFPMNK